MMSFTSTAASSNTGPDTISIEIGSWQVSVPLYGFVFAWKALQSDTLIVDLLGGVVVEPVSLDKHTRDKLGDVIPPIQCDAEHGCAPEPSATTSTSSSLLVEATESVNSGSSLVPIDDGEGTTFFVPPKENAGSHNNNMVGVFKPATQPDSGDAEHSSPMLQHVPTDQVHLREIVAYELDHEHSAGVPETILAELPTPNKPSGEIGSLQRYVSSARQSWDGGYRSFDTERVHNIGLLDLRLLNLDRHGGNVLVSDRAGDKEDLIPIDHAFCLPRVSVVDSLSDLWFEWMNWSQSKEPFSKQTIARFNQIDIDDDVRVLQRHGITDPEVLFTLRLCHSVVHAGINAGLTLHDLGLLFCRKGVLQQCVQALIDRSQQQQADQQQQQPSTDQHQQWDQQQQPVDQQSTNQHLLTAHAELDEPEDSCGSEPTTSDDEQQHDDDSNVPLPKPNQLDNNNNNNNNNSNSNSNDPITTRLVEHCDCKLLQCIAQSVIHSS